MTVADDLVAAKAMIEEPANWTKHPKSLSPMCAYAAVMVACQGPMPAGHTERSLRAQEALSLAMGQSPFGTDVIAFNDAPDTTHADVLALFDRAIALSRKTVVEGAK